MSGQHGRIIDYIVPPEVIRSTVRCRIGEAKLLRAIEDRLEHSVRVPLPCCHLPNPIKIHAFKITFIREKRVNAYIGVCGLEVGNRSGQFGVVVVNDAFLGGLGTSSRRDHLGIPGCKRLF